MFTPWGYEVESLPPLLGVDDYAAITGNAADSSTESSLAAASAAIRNICGWHVAPSLRCSGDFTAEGRVVRVPARLITSIYDVEDDGTPMLEGDFEAHQNGLIRRTCFAAWSKKWQGVHVEYQAGFDLSACPDICDVIARIVDSVSAIPLGVASETAGNVSISYSAAASGVAAQAAHAYEALLSQYKLVSAHAA